MGAQQAAERTAATEGHTLVAYSRRVTGRRRPGVDSTERPEKAKPAAQWAAATLVEHCRQEACHSTWGHCSRWLLPKSYEEQLKL